MTCDTRLQTVARSTESVSAVGDLLDNAAQIAFFH